MERTPMPHALMRGLGPALSVQQLKTT